MLDRFSMWLDVLMALAGWWVTGRFVPAKPTKLNAELTARELQALTNMCSTEIRT